jgi:hypothetical protein
MIVWNLNNIYPQINAEDTSSTLSAFAGEISICLSEMNVAMDTYKTRVSILEGCNDPLLINMNNFINNPKN